MDHSMPGGHGGMGHDMPLDRCAMNMLFTWDTTNLCIIFPSWHIRGTVSLTLSIVAIVLITAFYEFIRDFARKYEAQIYEQSKGLPNDELSSLVPMSGSSAVKISKQAHAAKALLYAAQVFYSFSIMLLFMTYNGWVMLAVATGAFTGYMIWGTSAASRSIACH